MSSIHLKGSLSLLILHVLSEEDHHGYRIAKRIKDLSEGVLDFKEGTLYPTLHQLEKQGYITAYEMVEAGRKRRYYRLTDTGQGALAAQHAEWQQFAQAVNRVLQRGEAS